MIYTEIDGVKLSRLGMGNMRLPVSTKFVGHIDEARAQELIDYCMDHGVNYYDTAYVYHKGASESFLGQALLKYPRDSYHLATKFFVAANPNFKAVFKSQLEKLKTDYIDFYLMHSVLDISKGAYGPAIKYFTEQKEKGRIKRLGFSAHMSPKSLRKFVKKADWDFVQLQLNYEDWLFGQASELYEIATEAGLPIIVMEPVKGGNLSSLGAAADAILKEREPDRSISSWAFRYLMTKPNVKVILSGMSTLEQVKDNVGTFSEECPLTDDETSLLENVCRMTHNSNVVPCTSCRYCCDTCPRDIEIPRMMHLYNMVVTDGAKAAREAAAALDMTHGPETCIDCGRCAEHCPQSIAIPATIRKLSRELGR